MRFELLKELAEASAVPGREEALRAIVKRELDPLVDELFVDVMGNVIGHKKGGGGPSVMIAAHMDEIGFIVKFIDDKGFLRLQPLGGHDPRQMFAQRVKVTTRNSEVLTGALCYATRPPHTQSEEESKEKPKIEKFFVDLGLPVDEVKDKVSLGDCVTMDRTLVPCGNHVTGKAIDNRVGVYVMLEALRALGDHTADVIAVATVQEEIGLRGAGTSSFDLEPDVGIALDTTLANDFPGQQPQDEVTKLGEGVAIKIMDASLICHPALVQHFRAIAEQEKIPHQMEILGRGGTDAGALQRSRGGNASITLSIPTRYIHSVNEMASPADIDAAVQLLAAYLAEAHEGDYQYR